MDTEGRREAYDGFRVIKSCLQYVVNAPIGSVEGIRLYLSLSVCLAVRQSSVSLARSLCVSHTALVLWMEKRCDSVIHPCCFKCAPVDRRAPALARPNVSGSFLKFKSCLAGVRVCVFPVSCSSWARPVRTRHWWISTHEITNARPLSPHHVLDPQYQSNVFEHLEFNDHYCWGPNKITTSYPKPKHAWE